MKMEVKKSHSADLEHRKGWVFVTALVGVTLLFVGVLFIPFSKLAEMMDSSFDDYAMDMELPKKDDMIAAAKKEVQRIEKPEKLNKVDEAAEPVDELPETPQEPVDETKEVTEDEPPVNLNDDSEETLRMVEELPEYPGGMVAFVKWLTENLKYPEAALRQHIEGRVMISFIVNKDGSLSDIKVRESANKLLDTEALRVAKMMPNWKPGKEKGKPCKSMMAVPIVFEI